MTFAFANVFPDDKVGVVAMANLLPMQSGTSDIRFGKIT